jgi:hypothetical protein
MEKSKRTPMLEALCLLSFTGNGMAFVANVLIALFFRKTGPWIMEAGSVPEQLSLSAEYFLIFGLFFAISIFGVFLMWNLRISGFYIYLAARIAIISYPLVMAGRGAFSAVVLIFSLVFILLYSFQVYRFRHYSLDN